jgi:hypothetical protein
MRYVPQSTPQLKLTLSWKWMDRIEATEYDNRRGKTRSVAKRARQDQNSFDDSDTDPNSNPRKRHHPSGWSYSLVDYHLLSVLFAGVMKSHFHLSSRTNLSVIVTRTSVALKKIICSVEEVTGDFTFEDAGEVFKGQLADTPMSSGSMKHAYEVCRLIL